jgi:hypothetical protein
VRALDDSTQRNFFHGACIGESYVEGVISTGDRTMLVNGTEISLVVEKKAAILNRPETHDGFLVVELYPERIVGRHRDFVMGVKANELEGRSAGSIDDSLDIGVGDANDGVAAAVAATDATKFQIFLPVLRRHPVLDYQQTMKIRSRLQIFLQPLEKFFIQWGHGWFSRP